MSNDELLPTENLPSSARASRLAEPEWRPNAIFYVQAFTGWLVLGAAGMAGAAWLLQWTILTGADRFDVDLQAIATDVTSNIGGALFWLALAFLAVGAYGYWAGRELPGLWKALARQRDTPERNVTGEVDS